MSILSPVHLCDVPSSSSSSAAFAQSASSSTGLSVAVSSIAREMITPQEQLSRLAGTAARESVATCHEKTDKVVERLSVNSLPAALTHWYTALELLGALPDKIPALPSNIGDILKGKCPIYQDQLQPDGISYAVSDTHSLYLIPAGTLTELESLVSAYGQQTLHADPNPPKFLYFWDKAREHANVRFKEHQWILISNYVLPGSRDQPYKLQAQMVADVSARSLANYEVPSLREAVGAIFLHKIATGESLYPGCDTFTRVQETTYNSHLTVGIGGSISCGVCVNVNCMPGVVGVAALRKL